METFISNLPPSTWATKFKPKVKTLRGKLQGMMKDRRNVVSENEGASSISEDGSQVDQLLDENIHEKDEVNKKK